MSRAFNFKKATVWLPYCNFFHVLKVPDLANKSAVAYGTSGAIGGLFASDSGLMEESRYKII